MYLIQTSNYDCGPVALLNYLSWEGFTISKKDIALVRNMVETSKKGTEALKIYSALLSMNPESALCIGMKGWDMVRKHLETRPVLIAFNIKSPHIVFTAKVGRKILLANFTKNHVVMTKKALKAFLKNSKTQPIFMLC